MRLVWRLYDEFMQFPVTMGWYKKVDLNASIPAARNGGRSRASTAGVPEAESPDLDLRDPGVRLRIPCNAASGNVLEVGQWDGGVCYLALIATIPRIASCAVIYKLMQIVPGACLMTRSRAAASSAPFCFARNIEIRQVFPGEILLGGGCKRVTGSSVSFGVAPGCCSAGNQRYIERAPEALRGSRSHPVRKLRGDDLCRHRRVQRGWRALW